MQDPGALLAIRELDPRPGENILDFCAAPGGKTTYIAQLMNNAGQVVASDVSAERLKRVQENCARLGATCVEARLGRVDGRWLMVDSGADHKPSTLNHQPPRLGEESGVRAFDRILVDAPCSNTGVMRRRVDLRRRIRPEEIERLRATQLKLLGQAATLVRPGGVLVYSTCSLELEENSEVIKQFLGEHAEFKLERERELLPFADGVDGAYVARLKRVNTG